VAELHLAYGTDPRMLLGDEIAESELFLQVLLEAADEQVKQQERAARKR
jgi:hypothetical protein